MRISSYALLAIAFGCLPAVGSDAIGVTRDDLSEGAINKWQDMRFGMFIHWGPVSLKGTEIGWSRGNGVPSDEYDSLYKKFNPTEFDADEWAHIAKDAGMKYLVITAKHHDGFCLWPSKYTDYDIANTSFQSSVAAPASSNRRSSWHDPPFAEYAGLLDHLRGVLEVAGPATSSLQCQQLAVRTLVVAKADEDGS